MSRHHPTKRKNPCLDLHGKRRDEAIRSFTSFSEQHSTEWIVVVTGTGRHSSQSGGPVLKNALERLLKKREMEYRYEKGCFHVNCNSGHELVRPEHQVDSKIQLQPMPPQETKLENRCRNNQNSDGDFHCVAQHEPLPRQVALYDKTVQQTKLKSVAEYENNPFKTKSYSNKLFLNQRDPRLIQN